MISGKPVVAVFLLASMASVAQTAPAAKPASPPAQLSPQTAPRQGKKPDHAAAYYHYAMAHMYEELVAMYGRPEYANKAIDEYRLAIENDPASEYLNSGLAELYAKTGRIRDAVVEAQEIVKRDPNNLEARKLLGRIYLRSLPDSQVGAQSQEILKRAIEQYEAICRLEPKNVEDHVLLGRLYRLNNELIKAENEFKTAVSLDPGSEEALTTLAYLYNEEGDSARAAQVLKGVPDSQRSSKLYSALGYTYEQQKDYKNAIAAYKKAVDSDHDNLDAIRGLAQNLMNDNQTEAALEQYQTIVESDPHDVQSLMRIAEIQRRSGKFDDALATLKKAEAEVQDSLEVPYNMAVIYQAQGKFDDAIQILNNLLQKSEKADGNYTPGERNNRAVFLERLGTIYRDTGKTQLAAATFRKMLTLGDDNVSRGYQQLIDTYREAKQWKEATAVSQEAVAKVPKDRNLKMVLAGQLADTGQADQGLSLMKGMLKGTAEDREVYISLAQMYGRLKRWPEAEEALSKAAQLSKKQEEKDYVSFVAGSIYERQKKYDRAEEEFKKVLAGDPNNAVTLNYLGYMLADRGVRLEEALTYVKKAIQLDPQNGAYLDSLGWAYFKLGNFDLAEENLRKAMDRTQNDPTVLDHMGDLLQRTERLKLATAYWERALTEWAKSVPSDVDNTEVAKVQKKLDSAKVKLAKQNERKAEAVKP
ncbi:MAG TPA: tetratricopeptide repeat protein [Terriglobales bacterium]|jgi:tetratricopeptide (TPR) repeat protein|nr:tetratricopeptide repeat protein [Terriglobales bacterium]